MANLQLVGTNDCANWSYLTDAFTLNSCVAGDANEEFWMDNTSRGIVYVSYEASDFFERLAFMSAASLSEGTDLFAQFSVDACNGCLYWYLGGSISLNA